MNNKPSNQRANKFKDREAFSVRRVDMSQYLPKLELALSKKKTIDLRSPRSKSQNTKYQKVFLNDELSKRYSGYQPIEAKGKNVQKKNLPPMAQGRGHGHHASAQERPADDQAFFNSQAMISMSKRDTHEYAVPSAKLYKVSTKEQFIDFMNRGSLKEGVSGIHHSKKLYDSDGEDMEPSTLLGIKSDKRQSETVNYNVWTEMSGPEIDEPVHKQEEVPITEDELKEYQFLNQARSIPIVVSNGDEYEKIDISMQASSKEQAIINAINELKGIFYNQQATDTLVEQLDIVINCNYKEMRLGIDFTELGEFFCELLKVPTLDLIRKIKILAFMYFFCEDALFALTLSFDELYIATCNFTKELLVGKDALLFQKQNFRKSLHQSFLTLHKYFAKEIYLIEKSKVELIISYYLNFLCINLDVLFTDASHDQKLFNPDKIIPLFSSHGGEYIELFKILFKRTEARQYVLREEPCRQRLISVLNSIHQITIIAEKWNTDFLKEKMKQNFLQYILGGYLFFLTVFKYSECYDLERSPDISFKVEEIMIELFNWLIKVFGKKKLVLLMFQKAQDSISEKIPQSAHGFTGSELGMVIEAVSEIITNLKLFEDAKFNHENVMEKMIEVMNQINHQVKSKALSPDFGMFLEAVVKHPLKKLASKIVKNIKRIKGDNHFAKDPLANIH